MTGAELDVLSDEALWHVAERTSIFAEVDPNEKERIILALKKPVMWSAIWGMVSMMRLRCIAPMWVFR